MGGIGLVENERPYCVRYICSDGRTTYVFTNCVQWRRGLMGAMAGTGAMLGMSAKAKTGEKARMRYEGRDGAEVDVARQQGQR
jgi:hypothetical protein